MKSKKYYFLFIVLLPILVLTGLYIAAYLYAYMTKAGYNNVDLLYYVNSGMNIPKTGKLHQAWINSGILSACIVLSVLGLVVYKIYFSPDTRIYGDAKFASDSDLRKAGFYTPSDNSIVVGKNGNKYLYYSGQQFAILAAPTRSGKGTGVVIPNLLSYKESIVVLDIKQENFEKTSGFRAAHGQEVYLFNPFAEDGRSHRWNPLSYISKNPKFRVSDLSTLAIMLYPISLEGRDQFWKNQAQNAFIAICLYLFDKRNFQLELGCPADLCSPVTMGEVFRTASPDNMTLRDHLKSLAAMSFTSAEARLAFGGMLSQNDEVFPSIMGTFKEPLLPWLNPVVDQATSGDDFLLTDLRKKRMTIYIGILPNKLAEAKLILNMFFSQLVNENTRELPESNPELKHQCLLLMDEFTSIGRVDIISKSVSYMSGYNLRLFPIIQSLAQLDSVYGKEDARTMITNHALQIIYTPRIQSDANEYSEMLGYRSAIKESQTRAKDSSSNQSEEKRALMLPQELKAMSMDSEVIMYESIGSPIMAEKIKYYLDPIFKKRVLKKHAIPILV
jgi:type IV secretion system protein VirD4